MNKVSVSPYSHDPVLSQALISGLQIRSEGRYLDVTAGGGGHIVALLEAGAQTITALDQDPAALAATRSRIDAWLATSGSSSQTLTFCHLNFADFDLAPDQEGFWGIVADLGVSSPQLDHPERGFSFRHEGPLDMRMDPTATIPTAADWVNTADLESLVSIFSTYGEERYAKRIARQIVDRRPLYSTTQLADVVKAAVPPGARQGRIHPATRVFQALRIAVNQELQALETLLQRAPNWLHPGGRLAIISFHSLEDRQVKWHFRQDERLKIITTKPIQAQPQEIASNPRARSAKLRIAQRVDPETP